MTCFLEFCLNICCGPFLGDHTGAGASGEFGEDDGEESDAGEGDDLARHTIFGSIDQCLHVSTIHQAIMGSDDTEFSLTISTIS